MTETKFTPAPWEISNLKYFGYNISNGTRLIAQVYLEREQDCRMFTEEHPEFETQTKANATLIASAPEMYEALERVVNAMSPEQYPIKASDGMEVIQIPKYLQQAIDALKKARGE